MKKKNKYNGRGHFIWKRIDRIRIIIANDFQQLLSLQSCIIRWNSIELNTL